MKANARAHTNIALAKYWGKRDVVENLPATSSVSMTLDGFFTDTTVEWHTNANEGDSVLYATSTSAPALASPKFAERATRALAPIRERLGAGYFARIETMNSVPTGAGLASSASGFAALIAAASKAAQVDVGLEQQSAWARKASASAARSFYGGFAELVEGAAFASPLLVAHDWDIRMVVGVVDDAEKAVGSTVAMERSRTTSPFYQSWISQSRDWFREVRAAVLAKDLERAGTAMEASTFAMHATAMTSTPPIVYMRDTSWALVRAVQELRDAGTAAFVTLDAGPQVKVLCDPQAATQVEAALLQAGALRAITCRPGPAPSIRAL